MHEPLDDAAAVLVLQELGELVVTQRGERGRHELAVQRRRALEDAGLDGVAAEPVRGQGHEVAHHVMEDLLINPVLLDAPDQRAQGCAVGIQVARQRLA